METCQLIFLMGTGISFSKKPCVGLVQMLIIDTNAAAAVFDVANREHARYRPVLDYLFRRNGVLSSGGTRYLSELAKVRVALAPLKQLEQAGRLRIANRAAVDAEERRICELAPMPACDDQHLIALVCVSRARIIASDDRRADKFIKDRSLYSGGVRRPAIYRQVSHKRLLGNTSSK
jgi:hypothetical protein